MIMNLVSKLSLILFLIALISTSIYSVEVSLKNPATSTLNEIPVFIPIADIFGNEYDFSTIDNDKFIVLDNLDQSVEYSVMELKPLGKKGNDLIYFIVPTMSASQTKKYSIVYTGATNPDFQSSIDVINVASNLFDNGDFEGDFSQTIKPASGVELDSSNSHSGSNSLKLTASHNTRVRAEYINGVSARSGQKYEIRFWAKNTNLPMADSTGHDATTTAGQIFDADRGWQPSATFSTNWWHSWIKPISGTRDWTHYSYKITGRKNQVSMPSWRLYMYQMKWMDDAPGEFWIDDVLFYTPLEHTIDNDIDTLASNNALLFKKTIQELITSSTIPSPQDILSSGKGIDATLAKDDYETFLFGVKATANLNAVSFSVTDLISGANTIDTSQMELFHLNEENLDGKNTYLLRDLADRQIVNGNAQGYALRLHVPQDVQPGVYTAQVTVSNGGTTLGTFPLSITVIPYELPPVTDRYLGNIVGFRAISNMGDPMFKNAAEHSYNFINFFDYTGICQSHNNMDTLIARMEAQGMFVAGVGMFTDVCRRCQTRHTNCHGVGTISQMESSRQSRNWPAMLYMIDDEMFVDYNGYNSVDQVRRALDNRKQGDFNWVRDTPTAFTYADANFIFNSFFHEPYSIVGLDNPYGGLNQQMMDWMEHDIQKEWGYTGPNGHSYPEYQRLSSGFNIILLNIVHTQIWYHGNIVKHESGRMIDTVQHEAMREGYDDVAWYYLFSQAVEGAKNSGDASKIALANQAETDMQEYFDLFSKDTQVGTYQHVEGMPGLDWGEFSFYDSWRNMMINYIVQLAGDSECGNGIEEILEDCNSCSEDVPCSGVCTQGGICCLSNSTDAACLSLSCTDGDTRACGSDVGTCSSGIQYCTNGLWSTCVGEVRPTSETCDGLDNDCNGEIDNNCPCIDGETQTCGVSEIGRCALGGQVCSAIDGWGECIGAVYPRNETCNYYDDDCDGEIDEGLDCIVYNRSEVSVFKQEDLPFVLTETKIQECEPDFETLKWGECRNSIKTRIIVDLNECANSIIEVQDCVSEFNENISNFKVIKHLNISKLTNSKVETIIDSDITKHLYSIDSDKVENEESITFIDEVNNIEYLGTFVESAGGRNYYSLEIVGPSGETIQTDITQEINATKENIFSPVLVISSISVILLLLGLLLYKLKNKEE